jgi:cytoskeletal protein CcmA (bactofilin family)
MFNRNAQPAPPDGGPVPVSGMREMAPVAPAPAPMPAPAAPLPAPVHDESIIAHDDEVEGTFRSRGSVRVLGRMKGRIEAVRVHIEDGASVEADIVADEAIVAGAYVGTLTCRQRLEVRASGRLSGRVETFRVMLHEGASVEGEMHMLKGPGETENIRGKGHVRGAPAAQPAPAQSQSPRGDGNGNGNPVPSVTPRASVPVEPGGQPVG